MKKFKLLVLVSLFPAIGFAQENRPRECKADEMMKKHFELHPESKAEYENFEKYTKDFVKKMGSNKNSLNNSRMSNPTYIIPVVFHVYGESQSNVKVNYQKVVDLLQQINLNFNGINTDSNTVDPYFQSIRGALSIEFRLAKIDPTGKATSGVVFHPFKGGYGNGGGYDAQIGTDAWDNTKYMNVYIQNDLYANKDLYQSGVAWYPDSYMSSVNTARVVYNGRYIFNAAGTVASNEFSDTFTHEFGHWLNLQHTFNVLCSTSNPNNDGDGVADTPVENASSGLGCNSGNNCLGQKVNVENYMGYNGSSGCYKMFTNGQVNRMLAALNHPSRINLWQPANLAATGVANNPPRLALSNSTFTENLNNNGVVSLDGTVASAPISTITLNTATFAVPNGTTLTSGTHFTSSLPAGLTASIVVTSPTTATLTINGAATSHSKSQVLNSSITFLNPAITGGVTSLGSTTALALTFSYKDPYKIVTGTPLESYANPTPTTVTTNSGATWKYFIINPELSDDAGYGAWYYGANQLKLETYWKGLVCQTGTRNISLIPACTTITNANNIGYPTWTPGQLDVYTPTYTTWSGKTAYVGFRNQFEGYDINGYFKVSVGANGSNYSVTEFAYNTQPNGSITTPCALSFSTADVDTTNSETSIYPNPVSDVLNIKTKGEIKSISVYDMFGRKMNAKVIGDKVEVKHFLSGTYLIDIETSLGKSSQKFIKK